MCAELLTQLPPRRELFVVSLDIKSFFDRIDTAALLQELRRIEEEHRQTFGLPDSSAADAAFWQYTERIFGWQWRSKDHMQAELMYGAGHDALELGLPQGLLASGFLANAYLLRLDRELHQAAAQASSVGHDVKLHDYCRYVDDMRMVVEAPSGTGGLEPDAILDLVDEFVATALKSHCELLKTQKEKVLELSTDKRGVTPYRSISAQSNLSALMDVLNAELSGTFDMESLAQAAGGLDGLLWMSDQIDDVEAPKPSRLRLATVAAPSTDVRDDTVKRFVATRLTRLMRDQLAMTDTTAHTSTGNVLSDRVTNGMALAHEFESTARKLIKCWSENRH